MEDTRLFPHVAYVSRARWRRFTNPYIIEVDSKFTGVCAVYTFDNWIKLGPLVLLQKYHGKGLGKKLLLNIINDYNKTSIFMASSNPAVQHIIKSYNFQLFSSFLSLPMEVQMFLFRQLVEHLNVSFVLEGIRKKFFLKRLEIKFYARFA